MAKQKEQTLDQKGIIPFDEEIHVLVIIRDHDPIKQEYIEREVRVSKELAHEQLSLPVEKRHPKWRNVRYKETKKAE